MTKKSQITIKSKIKKLFARRRNKVIGVIVGIFIILLIIGALNGGASACPSPSSLDKSITARQLTENPDGYKCKTVQLTGRIFNTEKQNGSNALQVWTNPDKSEGNVIVYYVGSTSLGNDDYVSFTGVVGGQISGQNAFGGTVAAPAVKASSIKKISRDDAVAPALKIISPNQSQSNDGLIITVKKVEFASSETRVYLTVKNDGPANANFYSFDLKLVQAGSQIKDKSIFEGTDDIPSEILPNTSESGKVYYQSANPDKPLTLSYKSYSLTEYKDIYFSFDLNQ